MHTVYSHMQCLDKQAIMARERVIQYHLWMSTIGELPLSHSQSISNNVNTIVLLIALILSLYLPSPRFISQSPSVCSGLGLIRITPPTQATS
jgi:hypothetical protein